MKKDAAGNIVHHKACLVMQGFSQVSRVDYFDTYAPVAKLASIRMVLTLATCLNLELHQIDIKGAYLNGELNNNKYIYMHQPPGYADLALPCHVCCLHKTLYGLKQSGHHWYQKLVEILVKNLGFKLWEVDQAMFVKLIKKTLTIIIEHVDDCTITTSSLSLIVKLKVQIRKHVKITNLGKLHWFISKLISYCSDWTALDNVPLSQGPTARYPTGRNCPSPSQFYSKLGCILFQAASVHLCRL